MVPDLTSNSRDYAVPSSSVRAIPRNRRSVTGFLSWRGEQSIQYESTLERDFVIRQEFSLAVAQVISQPCVFPFTTRTGRSANYTPDFLVVYGADSSPVRFQRRPLLVEVKPAEEWHLHWREWLPKWKAARRYAASQGWTFRIMDESRIRTQALANIQFLRRYRNSVYPSQESDWIVASVRELGSATFDYLLAKHFPGIYAAEGVGHLWSLLASRRLDCDICSSLGGDTELWVPDEA
ncbi:TnsA endonuclease N-terminal domain-containing protein [Roseateles sp.]|uniref:TnsA endonuclease N-terminal domain-containing protein n=1 Tax=Roseateles sp. TaxID=1971397 RepID=UPI00326731F3